MMSANSFLLLHEGEANVAFLLLVCVFDWLLPILDVTDCCSIGVQDAGTGVHDLELVLAQLVDQQVRLVLP